ncbi:Transmembrane protein 19 [Triticum urartu]|uniref:Transmembrane protein 19 n=1 Tax=Triticum urartu TaxID=4572 RepID=M7ZVC6_TRIUA|nr:Transmembrane protein 19 [Triticum urartu]
MDPAGVNGGVWIRAAVAVAAGGAIAARAVRRKSVDFTAVFAGVPAMVAHTGAGYRFAGLLLVFFFTASRVRTTLIGRKQVLSNSGIASILVVLIALITGGEDKCLDSKESGLVTALIGGVIGHYSCCNGDTWSSELGILSKSEPRIITTFKRVRKGTNGGVTIDGLLAAAAAGCSIGLAFVLLGFLTTQCASDVFWRQLLVIPLATAAGLCGSLIDSLLGATVQYSGYCRVRKKVVGVDGPTVTRISGMNILDNNGVNVVSIFLTSLLTALEQISHQPQQEALEGLAAETAAKIEEKAKSKSKQRRRWKGSVRWHPWLAP